jgi:hypothetical protein
MGPRGALFEICSLAFAFVEPGKLKHFRAFFLVIIQLDAQNFVLQ